MADDLEPPRFSSPGKKVDESWKEAVNREKQTGSAPSASPPAPAREPAASPRQNSVPPPPPAPDEEEQEPADSPFLSFVSTLGIQSLAALGEMPNPATGTIHADLGQARYLIDTLALLAEKTQGNLTREEDSVLRGLLYDLQMVYVKKAGGAPA